MRRRVLPHISDWLLAVFCLRRCSENADGIRKFILNVVVDDFVRQGPRSGRRDRRASVDMSVAEWIADVATVSAPCCSVLSNRKPPIGAPPKPSVLTDSPVFPMGCNGMILSDMRSFPGSGDRCADMEAAAPDIDMCPGQERRSIRQQPDDGCGNLVGPAVPSHRDGGFYGRAPRS